MEIKNMSYEEWEAKYKPHLNDDGSLRQYETYGEDMNTVRANFRNAWTMLATGEGRYCESTDEPEEEIWIIASKIHWVNRLYYIITKEPHNDEEVEVEY